MLRQIQYFQAVVKNNSFSRAAEECHISQSAISQQVQALERELGFILLDRKNRTFTLTPAGAYFYQKSLILVDDYEADLPGGWPDCPRQKRRSPGGLPAQLQRQEILPGRPAVLDGIPGCES